MTTDAPARDKLSGYPCPTHMHHHDVCDGDCAWRAMCDLKPIYDAYIALRADMRKLRAAVLVGSLTAHMSAEVYRGVAIYLNRHGCDGTAAHFDALADMVAKLDA